MYLKSEKSLTRRAEQARALRESILDRAMIMMAEKGYSGTRLEDVAADLQVTRGAIYRHFKNKPSLYREILTCSQAPLYEVLDQALASPGLGALGRLEKFMNDWLDLLFSNSRHRYSTEIFLNKSEMIPEVEDVYQEEVRLTNRLIDGLETIFRQGLEDGEIALGQDPRQGGLLVYSQLMGLMQTWLFNPRLFDLASEKEALIRPFLQSFTTSTPRSGGIL